MKLERRKIKDLSKISVNDLYGELLQRRARVQKLIRRYERLQAQIQMMRREIEANGGFKAYKVLSGRSSTSRAQNQVPLPKVIQSVLAGKELSIDEIVR